MNLPRSVLFPVNDKAHKMSFQNYPFSVNINSFTHLGICVTSKYRDLLKNNFKPAFNKAKQDMERWPALPLSLAGRINTVKMAIMLSFLFLFQAIPIFIPKSFYKELNACRSTFIWNKKVPQIFIMDYYYYWRPISPDSYFVFLIYWMMTPQCGPTYKNIQVI